MGVNIGLIFEDSLVDNGAWRASFLQPLFHQLQLLRSLLGVLSKEDTLNPPEDLEVDPHHLFRGHPAVRPCRRRLIKVEVQTVEREYEVDQGPDDVDFGRDDEN